MFVVSGEGGTDLLGVVGAEEKFGESGESEYSDCSGVRWNDHRRGSSVPRLLRLVASEFGL